MHPGDRTVDIWSSDGPMALTEQMKMVPQRELTTHRPIQEPREHRFSPYEFNGGTVIGIAGDDFVVLGADTRLSSGYSILSRDVSKATVFNDTVMMATGGCRTDVATLQKVLKVRAAQYHIQHKEHIGCTQTAQLLSTTLYYRRFFPYYAFNIVAGIDSEGKGGVFTYDAIGFVNMHSVHHLAVRCSTAHTLISWCCLLSGHLNVRLTPRKVPAKN